MADGIGWAIKELRDGRKVRRAGWNGKDMYLILVPGTVLGAFREGSPYARALGSNQPGVPIDPHIDMFTATGSFQPGWLASQADLLAVDWESAEAPQTRDVTPAPDPVVPPSPPPTQGPFDAGPA